MKRLHNLTLLAVIALTIPVGFTACTKDAPKAASPSPDEADQNATDQGNTDQGNNNSDASNQSGQIIGSPTGRSSGGGGAVIGGESRARTASDAVCSSKPSYKAIEGSVTQDQIKQWADQHRLAHSADSEFLRYTYIPLDALENAETANLARVGLWKALNHTAIDATEIYVGEDVSDGHGIVYAIDTRKLWGANDALRKWDVVANARGKDGIISVGDMGTRAFDQLAPAPADQLAYNAVHSNIYNVLINTPPREYNLRSQLDVKNNIEAWGAQKEAIVFGPRVMWMSQTADGRKYWATGDEFNGREGKEIPYKTGNPVAQFRQQREHMLAVRGGGAVASEAWVEMKNGCQAYYVWGNAAQERGRAEKSFVVDPANETNGYLITGRSCITCHTQGPHSAPSDMATAIEKGEIAPQYMAAARDFWTPNDRLGTLYKESRDRFQNQCMKPVVCGVSDAAETVNKNLIYGVGEEPVQYMIRRIEGSRNRGNNNRNSNRSANNSNPAAGAAGAGGGW